MAGSYVFNPTRYLADSSAQAQSRTRVTARDLTARQGGHAIWNAMLAWRLHEHATLQLNVNNLFDKTCFRKYDPADISNYYGDPRNAMLTLRAQF